ncbi:hypothetical protein B0H13DRAFT_2077309 [Mycena leptocephala]|nr:hypothetical protein B0H13DRAFT_2077309 [Mycena leptocephala]
MVLLPALLSFAAPGSDCFIWTTLFQELRSFDPFFNLLASTVSFASNQYSAKLIKPVVETPPIGRLSRLSLQFDNHPPPSPTRPSISTKRTQNGCKAGLHYPNRLLPSRGITHFHLSVSRLAVTAQAQTKHEGP